MKAEIIGCGIPFKLKYTKDGIQSTSFSIVSFVYDSVGTAHIIVDDHCYLVCIKHFDTNGDEYFSPTRYIFNAALEILKQLPDTWSDEFYKLYNEAKLQKENYERENDGVCPDAERNLGVCEGVLPA